MAAYLHDEMNETDFPKDIKKTDECFFCGEQLHHGQKDIGGVIVWHGHAGFIVLHQCCAELLGMHLIQDARSLISITGKNCKLIESPIREMKHLWHYKAMHK